MEDIEDNPPDNWGSRSAGTTSHFFCHGWILPPSRLNYNFLVHTYGKAHKKERFPGIPTLRLGQGFLGLQRNKKCIMDYKLLQFV